LLLRRGLRNIYPDSITFVQFFIREIRQALNPPGLIVGFLLGENSNGSTPIREVLPWLHRINRLNHGFASVELRQSIQPEHESSARRIRAHYRSQTPDTISGRSDNWIRRRVILARRRGWIICFPVDSLDHFMVDCLDLLIIFDSNESSPLVDKAPSKVCVQGIPHAKNAAFVIAHRIVQVLWNGVKHRLCHPSSLSPPS